MKLSCNYIILIIVLVFFSCSSSKSKSTPEQLNKLNHLVQSKHFEIISDMAYPTVTNAMNSLQNSGLIAPGNSVNQFYLEGNVNFVRIIGDSVFAELPYFGERQISAGYNGSDNSISIKGLFQNYKVEQDTKGNNYTISFTAKSKTEKFQFNMILFPNLKTSMFLNSSSRFSIRYSGVVNELKIK